MTIPNLDITNTSFTVADFFVSSNNVINDLNVIANTYANTLYVSSQVDTLSNNFNTSIDNKVNTSDFTANNILNMIKTVDGVSSGLDADLLAGNNGAFYKNASNLDAGTLPSARLSGSYTGVQDITVSANTVLARVVVNGYGAFGANVSFTTNITVGGSTNTTTLNVAGIATANTFVGDGTSITNVNATNLNGQAGSYYLNATNLNAGIVPNARISGSYTNFTSVTGSATATFTKTLMGNGSNTAPSYSFTNDTDTGWYLSSDGNITVSTAGSQRGNFNSTGMTVTGSIVASGQITGFSDERVKDNVQRIQNASDLIRQIEGVSFEMNGQKGTVKGEKGIGVIAQKLLPILPALVKVPENPDDPMSVAYGQFAGLFIEVFKEVLDRLDKLENKDDN